MSKTDREAGVTLLELMVVVVLIGILALMSMPKLQAFLSLQRLTADANRLDLDIQWARTLAAKSSIRHYLVFSGRSWGIYQESSSPRNLTFDGSTAEHLLKNDSLSPGIQFGTSGFTALPSGPAATTGLASVAVAPGGFASGAASDNCVDGAASGAGTWNGRIVFCGGRGIPDMETGALYLSSSVSTARIEGILYNDVNALGGFQIQRWTWEGGTWNRK